MSARYQGVIDEQLAFLLQQEEYGALDIQHVVLPPLAASSSSLAVKTPSKAQPHPHVIVLDDSTEEEIAPLAKTVEKAKPQNHDEIGILDVHQLFVEYNDRYFEGKLGAVSVEWSAKMTLCAGLCCWNFHGDCRIKLSSKLLQYRSNNELKETLLHECIHAYLFVTHNNKDRDGHGPEFLKLMNHINAVGGFNISVYHTFHDEVDHFRTHWWQCDRCKNIIKRAMNRAPGPSDWWFPRHQRECGGNYLKIKSPPEKEKNKKRKRDDSLGPNSEKDPEAKKARPRAASLGSPSTAPPQGSPPAHRTAGFIKAWILGTPQPKPTQPK
jgi:predicted SprT family Zn-dependent metalloprotease